ncbi:hypothetical protein IPA_02395 [Ignicoccus pacificus DSM 13166]|uniref:CRISPR type III-associated protein domain-containing protein n=1 Tax=Ignicoccus pacificus DSM 13166 TaxID=940294 RepID=A0A977KBQ9_9CREN|nr:hypothetical protein IPA_02395 [Ignicoccus pacificus DSM 13166]
MPPKGAEDLALNLMIALTQIHVGIGRAPGAVDLPIARDAFGLPYIPASSIKGTIKSACIRTFNCSRENAKECPCLQIYGRDPRLEDEVSSENSYLSPVNFTDAFLLLFPVRVDSPKEGLRYGYVTSMFSLNKFATQILPFLSKEGKEWNLKCWVEDSEFSGYLNDVYIGEVRGTLRLSEVPYINAILERLDVPIVKYLLQRGDIYVLKDNDFKEVVEAGIVRQTRVRLDFVRKTVQRGALWTEEYLPEGAVFSFLTVTKTVLARNVIVEASRAMNDHEEVLRENLFTFEIGGKETIGKGMVRVVEGPRVCCL